MKYLALIVLIVGSIACKETTSEYDKLSEADKAYIRNLSASLCREKFAKTFLNFKDISGRAWDLNTGYKRGNGFHQEYLDGTVVLNKADFKIWKVNATDIYFYVTENLTGSTDTGYFLKISRVINEDMITNLAEDFCTKKYTGNSSGSTGPLTLNQESTTSNGSNANHTDHYLDIYTIGFDKPLYLGPYSVTRTITTTDRLASGGTVIGTVKSYKTTMVSQTYTFVVNAQFNNVAYTQKFCVPTETTGEGAFRLYEFPLTPASGANPLRTATPSATSKFGYNFVCATDSTGWDLHIDF